MPSVNIQDPAESPDLDGPCEANRAVEQGRSVGFVSIPLAAGIEPHYNGVGFRNKHGESSWHPIRYYIQRAPRRPGIAKKLDAKTAVA